MSYRVAGSLEFVTKLPTPSDRVLKISRKANGRILGDASLIVTPVFAKEHKALIKQIFPLKIEIFFQTKEIFDWTNETPALLSINKISQTGLVTLGFSKEVIVLKNTTVLFDKNYFGYPQELHENLEMLVIKDLENKN